MLLLILGLLMPFNPVALDSTQTAALPFYPAPIDTVEVGGRPVAFYDSGGAGEPVLFVHGLGSNLSFWRENLVAFEEAGYRALALDLPGYGLSGKADVPGTMPFFAETVAGFLGALGVEEAHYVGLSMGGQVGLTFALEHPERLRKLVLVSPAGIETFTDEEAAALTGLMTPEAIQNTPPAQVRQNIALNFAAYDSARYGWIFEQRQALRQQADYASYAEANARAIAGMLDGPVFDRLGEVEAPTLVLFGTGDKLIPNRFLHPELTAEAVAQSAAAALPNAKLQMIEDAGHLLIIERPEAFSSAVLAFLESEE